MANELYRKNGKFELKGLKLIGDQFDTANIKTENGEYRNTNIIKLLLKTDMFKSLYGYELIT